MRACVRRFDTYKAKSRILKVSDLKASVYHCTVVNRYFHAVCSNAITFNLLVCFLSFPKKNISVEILMFFAIFIFSDFPPLPCAFWHNAYWLSHVDYSNSVIGITVYFHIVSAKCIGISSVMCYYWNIINRPSTLLENLFRDRRVFPVFARICDPQRREVEGSVRAAHIGQGRGKRQI